MLKPQKANATKRRPKKSISDLGALPSKPVTAVEHHAIYATKLQL